MPQVQSWPRGSRTPATRNFPIRLERQHRPNALPKAPPTRDTGGLPLEGRLPEPSNSGPHGGAGANENSELWVSSVLPRASCRAELGFFRLVLSLPFADAKCMPEAHAVINLTHALAAGPQDVPLRAGSVGLCEQ